MNINVKALAADLMQPAEDEARMLMRARRHLKPKEDDTFGVVEPSAIMELYNSVTGSLASGSIGIVAIFLVIGGIVIMNIMLASVTERTREIGVRKSLGATRRDVLLQFLVESGVMATDWRSDRRDGRGGDRVCRWDSLRRCPCLCQSAGSSLAWSSQLRLGSVLRRLSRI